LETVFDSKNLKTSFVICPPNLQNLGELITAESFTLGDGTSLLPLDGRNELLKSGYVKLASGVQDFESDEKLFFMVKEYIKRNVSLPEEFIEVSAEIPII